MTIQENRQDDILIIALKGGLDTTTSPELDQTLEKYDPSVNEIIFDFENPDYLSSAGLRVMLKAQKAMAGRRGILIRNASNLVMGVFQVTGFTDVLRFE